MNQLLRAIRNTSNGRLTPTLQFHATILRSLSAAWRLDLSPNPPVPSSQSWRTTYPGWWANTPRVPFIADGLHLEGDALLPKAFYPNLVRIEIPDWMPSGLTRTPYAKEITYMPIGLGQLNPVLVLRASSAAALQVRVAQARDDLSRIAASQGRSLDVWYLYGRDDCTYAVDAALYAATQAAIAKTPARSVRYLEERDSEKLGQISCTYLPTPQDYWSPAATFPHAGGSIASVIAGY